MIKNTGIKVFNTIKKTNEINMYIHYFVISVTQKRDYIDLTCIHDEIPKIVIQIEFS